MRRRLRRNPIGSARINQIAQLLIASGDGAETIKRLSIAAAVAALAYAGWPLDDTTTADAFATANAYGGSRRRLNRILTTCGTPECLAARGAVTTRPSDAVYALEECAPFAYRHWQPIVDETWQLTESLRVIVALLMAADVWTARQAVARVVRIAAAVLASDGDEDPMVIDLIHSVAVQIDESRNPNMPKLRELLRTYATEEWYLNVPEEIDRLVGALNDLTATQSERSVLVAATNAYTGAVNAGVGDPAELVRLDQRFAPPQVMP